MKEEEDYNQFISRLIFELYIKAYIITNEWRWERACPKSSKLGKNSKRNLSNFVFWKNQLTCKWKTFSTLTIFKSWFTLAMGIALEQ